MPKIQFQTNVPVTLSLLSLEGEVVESQFGGNQIKFVAREGPFWVSEAVGSILIDQIRKKHVQAHVPVEVCRREMAQGNGRKGIHWTIDALGFAPGEQPDGTFVVPAVPAPNGNGANGGKPPAPPAAIASQPHDEHPNGNAPVVGRITLPNGNGHANGTNGQPALHDGWALRIRELTQIRIQIYVDLCKWTAESYGGAVSKQEVQAFLMNVLISGDKGGPR
jgi:hypothetical protein